MKFQLGEFAIFRAPEAERDSAAARLDGTHVEIIDVSHHCTCCGKQLYGVDSPLLQLLSKELGWTVAPYADDDHLEKIKPS